MLMMDEESIEFEYVKPKLDGKYGFVLSFEHKAIAVFHDEVMDYQGPVGATVEKIEDKVYPLQVDTIPVAGSVSALELIYGEQTEVIAGFSQVMDGERVFREVKFKRETTIELERREGRLISLDKVDYGATVGNKGIVECVVRDGQCVELHDRLDRRYPQSSEILESLTLEDIRSRGTMDVIEMTEAYEYFRDRSFRYEYEKEKVVSHKKTRVKPLDYGAMWLEDDQRVQDVWAKLSGEQLVRLTNDLTPLVEIGIREPSEQILIKRGRLERVIMILQSGDYLLVGQKDEQLPTYKPEKVTGLLLVKAFLKNLQLATVNDYERFEMGHVIFYVVQDAKKSWVRGLNARSEWKFVEEKYLKIRSVKYLALVQRMLKMVRKFNYKKRRSEKSVKMRKKQRPGNRESVEENPGPRVNVIRKRRNKCRPGLEEGIEPNPGPRPPKPNQVVKRKNRHRWVTWYAAEVWELLGEDPEDEPPGLQEGIEENPGPEQIERHELADRLRVLRQVGGVWMQWCELLRSNQVTYNHFMGETQKAYDYFVMKHAPGMCEGVEENPGPREVFYLCRFGDLLDLPVRRVLAEFVIESTRLSVVTRQEVTSDQIWEAIGRLNATRALTSFIIDRGGLDRIVHGK